MSFPAGRPCLQQIKPYVPGKPVEEVERELGLKDVIKLASNENPLGPSPLALKALADSLDRLHYYPDGNCYYLKQALCKKLGVAEEMLVIGNGSDELLVLLAQAYLNHGDEAVMAQPSFSEHEFAVRVMGGVPRSIAMTGKHFDYDLQAMLAAVNDRTRLFFLCSPNNPTGTIIRRRQLVEFFEQLPPGILVVSDEAYYEYVTDPEYPDTLNYVRQGLPLIVLRTFSKIYGLAGLRVGYAIAPTEIVANLQRVREPFNVNSMAQVAALAALDDREHLERSLALVIDGREQLARGLAELGLEPVPSQGNFYFVDLGIDSKQVFQALLKRGVIVRTGDIFGHPTYIRVNFGTTGQNSRFLEALSAVLGELRQGQI